MGRTTSPSPTRSPARSEGGRRRNLIFHICCEKGYIAAECILPLRETITVERNYESLTPEELESVPSASYQRAVWKPEAKKAANSSASQFGTAPSEPPATPSGSQLVATQNDDSKN